MVLTRIAWATIVASAHRFSQDLQTTTWHSWLTFSLWLYPSYEPKDNKLRRYPMTEQNQLYREKWHTQMMSIIKNGFLNMIILKTIPYL